MTKKEKIKKIISEVVLLYKEKDGKMVASAHENWNKEAIPAIEKLISEIEREARIDECHKWYEAYNKDEYKRGPMFFAGDYLEDRLEELKRD